MHRFNRSLTITAVASLFILGGLGAVIAVQSASAGLARPRAAAVDTLPCGRVLPSGHPGAFLDCDCIDSDNDGLCDKWEIAGGIDLNGDGVIDEVNDLELPGADPHRPDIYLQYDYTDLPGRGGHTHRPSTEAIQSVVDAFAAHGIALHIHPGHHRLEHHSVITFDTFENPTCHGPDAVGFYSLKAKNFDPKRRLAYHYAVFGHDLQCDSLRGCGSCPSQNGFPAVFLATGQAELPGNDLIVATGPFFELGFVPTPIQEAGLFMHELGHNLGLQHGGNESYPEFKPNYLSVLNPSFTYIGIPFGASPGSLAPVGTRIDYSNAALPTLDENGLDETVGISANSNDITYYNCPDSTPVPGPGKGPIDWNCNGNSSESGLVADVNADGFFTRLKGYNDWTNLFMAFQFTAGFADAPPPEHLSRREPNVDDAFRSHRLFPPRGVKIQIRPGCAADRKPISPGHSGEVTVALLASDDFDLAQVDPASLRFSGARPVRFSAEDVNSDGRTDLLIVFDMARLRLNPDAHSAQLTGWLKNSQVFAGEDRVLVVPTMSFEDRSCRR